MLIPCPLSLFAFTSYIGSNRIPETDETDEIYRFVEILCTQKEFLKYIHEHYMVTGMKVNVQKNSFHEAPLYR